MHVQSSSTLLDANDLVNIYFGNLFQFFAILVTLKLYFFIYTDLTFYFIDFSSIH